MWIGLVAMKVWMRPGLRRLDRTACRVDVALVGTCQRTDGRILDGLGNRPDRIGIARAGCGKAGFDHIDTELFQLARNAQFLVLGHRRAGALLAVAQGGVKNKQTVFHGWLHGGSVPISMLYRADAL